MNARTWLRDLRTKAGLSQYQLAEKSNLNVTSINKYEIGLRTPRPSAAQRIAKELGFDWTRFYEPDSKQ